MSLPTVWDAKLIEIPTFEAESGGKLIAIEDTEFPIKRSFFVRDIPVSNSFRGNHAHKNTIQILVCTRGIIHVELKDGVNSTTIGLSEYDNKGLLVPAGLWDSQQYLVEHSELLVYSSSLYNDREDYIDDYQEFLKYRKL